MKNVFFVKMDTKNKIAFIYPFEKNKKSLNGLKKSLTKNGYVVVKNGKC